MNSRDERRLTGAVTSRDGTTIAVERVGDGPSLVLVDGALCYRRMGPSRPLAAQLASDFTVYAYDRRGRGESTDRRPYAIEREVEDLAAVIDTAGGAAYVYGVSSGAALALEAANQGLAIKKLAVYEAPLIVDDSRPPLDDGFHEQLSRLVAEHRRGDAVRLFLRAVGTPGVVVSLMRFLPVWSKLTAVAHTLPYDMAIVGPYERGAPLPPGLWSSVTVPTLVLSGGQSDRWMQHAMQNLAEVLPEARLRTLDGQTHMVKAKVHAPVLVEFFTG